MEKGKNIKKPSKKDSCEICLKNKVIIGSVEPVYIKGERFLARIDTGATKNSISKKLVKDLNLGPAIDVVDVKNSHGFSLRDVIWVDVELAHVKTRTKFNVSDRSKMRYPLLIGRNLLKKGFLVDCSNENRNN
jgi:hypothetical protein